jgi:hypothetical protein
MSETPESQSEESGSDWLEGATLEFAGEFGESLETPLEGIEFDDSDLVS